MFSSLAKGAGTWSGEIIPLQEWDGIKQTEDAIALPLLGIDDGQHRHGITVRPTSRCSTQSRAKSAASRHTGHSEQSAYKQDGEIVLPKTFLTRKGALLLFSSPDADHELSEKEKLYLKKARHLLKQRHAADYCSQLGGSVDRLVRSILMYGDQDYEKDNCSISDQKNQAFLGFLHELDNAGGDIHTQPGGDTSFYLRDLCTMSRAGSALSRAPSVRFAFDTQSVASGTESDLLAAEADRLGIQLTAPSSRRSSLGAGGKRYGSPCRSPQQNRRVLSASQLQASLKSNSYLGKPQSPSAILEVGSPVDAMSRPNSPSTGAYVTGAEKSQSQTTLHGRSPSLTSYGVDGELSVQDLEVEQLSGDADKLREALDQVAERQQQYGEQDNGSCMDEDGIAYPLQPAYSASGMLPDHDTFQMNRVQTDRLADDAGADQEVADDQLQIDQNTMAHMLSQEDGLLAVSTGQHDDDNVSGVTSVEIRSRRSSYASSHSGVPSEQGDDRRQELKDSSQYGLDDSLKLSAGLRSAGRSPAGSHAGSPSVSRAASRSASRQSATAAGDSGPSCHYISTPVGSRKNSHSSSRAQTPLSFPAETEPQVASQMSRLGDDSMTGDGAAEDVGGAGDAGVSGMKSPHVPAMAEDDDSTQKQTPTAVEETTKDSIIKTTATSDDTTQKTSPAVAISDVIYDKHAKADVKGKSKTTKKPKTHVPPKNDKCPKDAATKLPDTTKKVDKNADRTKQKKKPEPDLQQDLKDWLNKAASKPAKKQLSPEEIERIKKQAKVPTSPPVKPKKTKEEEKIDTLEKEMADLLTSREKEENGSDGGGLTVEELELEKQILQQRVADVEEKLKDDGEKPKRKPKAPAKKPGKKKREEKTPQRDLAQEREALREAKRLEKLKRLEEARALEKKIREKEQEKEQEMASASRKKQLLQQDIDAIRWEEEQARVAEEEARAMLAEARRAARAEREKNRKADIERKKQEIQRQRQEQREMMEAARKKEQEMLERIGKARKQRTSSEDSDPFEREEEERRRQEEEDEQDRLARQAVEEEEERIRELERQAEEEAMARLVAEREEAEQRRWELQNQARSIEEEENRRKADIEKEKQRLEEERLKQEEEEAQRREQERLRLAELKKSEEAARMMMVKEMEHRREMALLRREQNLERRGNLSSMRQSQGLTKPWLFSYYVTWPRETYERRMGVEPKKKKVPTATLR